MVIMPAGSANFDFGIGGSHAGQFINYLRWSKLSFFVVVVKEAFDKS